MRSVAFALFPDVSRSANFVGAEDKTDGWYRSRARIYPEPTVTLGPEQQQ